MAQRWDRDRFERMRGGGGPPPERDYYRMEEREHMSPRGRHEVMFDERISQKGPQGRYEERERFFEADRHAPARRAPPGFLDEPLPAEATRQALAPYRKPRPQFIRRQSSLDTFDRRPGPRYGDEYRMPADVAIPLPIRRHSPPRRGQYYEEFEERYRGSDEEYRDVSVKRDSGRSRSRLRSRSVRHRRSPSISSESSFEEVDKSSIIGRKGRTKLPKRLAHKSAVIELGYPYKEEEKFIIVQRALDKEHIDKIVELSKKYNADKVTYKYEGKADAPPAPPAAAPAPAAPAAPKDEKKVEIKKEEVKADGTKIEEKIEKTETKTVTPAPPAPPASAPPAPPPAAAPAAPPAPPAAAPPGELVKKTITTTTTIDPPGHHHRHQDLAVVVPRRLNDHDLQREIEMLEAERRLLRYERDGDWEIVEHRERKKDTYRVERDRKGRLALIRSAH